MRKDICDRCGKEILPFANKGLFIRGGQLNISLLANKEYYGIDLCTDCFTELKAWIARLKKDSVHLKEAGKEQVKSG